jgi:hypothetical protein
MLGVDRLDMIKGIPQKLLAFEMFLEKNPDWREKVLLVQIAVPTRTDVHECRPLGLHVLMSHSLAGCMFSCMHILSYTKNITCHLDELLIGCEEMFSFSVVIFSQQTWSNVEGSQCGFADQRLTSQVHEIVGRINGRFGTLTFMPIHHLDRSLAFHQLCALYAITGSLLLGGIALTLFAKDHLAWSIKVHGCTHKRNMQLFSCQGFLHVYGEEGSCFLIL